MKYTKWLNSTGMNEVDLVGGKNASLGEMIQNLSVLGIKIPDGFVVTSRGYDHFMKQNNLDEKIDKLMKSTDTEDSVNFRRNTLRIRTAIQNGEYPEDMKKEILNLYNELSRN